MFSKPAAGSVKVSSKARSEAQLTPALVVMNFPVLAQIHAESGSKRGYAVSSDMKYISGCGAGAAADHLCHAEKTCEVNVFLAKVLFAGKDFLKSQSSSPISSAELRISVIGICVCVLAKLAAGSGSCRHTRQIRSACRRLPCLHKSFDGEGTLVTDINYPVAHYGDKRVLITETEPSSSGVTTVKFLNSTVFDMTASLNVPGI